MKILPPITQWLPALARSRLGGGILGALAALVVTATTLALVGLPAQQGGDTSTAAGLAAADVPAGTFTPGPQTCSQLVLNRTDHEISATACRLEASRAGASILNARPLARTSMPPRNHELTAADRAISVPQSLRTSVWEVGIARPGAGDPTQAATATSPAATSGPPR